MEGEGEIETEDVRDASDESDDDQNLKSFYMGELYTPLDTSIHTFVLVQLRVGMNRIRKVNPCA
jgi:hypothetical protein